MANEPTNQELTNQIHDLDVAMDEKDQAIWEELKKQGGLVGTLQTTLNQLVKEVQQTKRVSRDMAFDTKQSIKEVIKEVKN